MDSQNNNNNNKDTNTTIFLLRKIGVKTVCFSAYSNIKINVQKNSCVNKLILFRVKSGLTIKYRRSNMCSPRF